MVLLYSSVTRIPVLSPQYVPGRRGIPMHLLNQCIERREMLFLAQLRDELHLDLAPVQISIEIEEMRLKQRLDPIDRRSRAETGDTREPVATGGATHTH